MIFELNDKPFIELNKLLKIMALVESGGQANLMITSGEVLVNGEIETAKRKKIKAEDQVEFMGWVLPSTKKLSFGRALGLLSFLNGKNKEYVIDANMKGGPRAFVASGQFEKVTPMDIYPTFLIKSILAEDFDEMEALGIYEVIEEDLALCEFIDVSKHDIQSIVRDGLNLMQYS